MSTFHDTVSILTPLLPWLGLAKVTGLLLVLFGASIALRRRAAAARHILWTVGFVALVSMPVLSKQIPWHLNIARLPAAPTPTTPAMLESAASHAAMPTPPTETPAGSRSAVSATSHASPADTPAAHEPGPSDTPVTSATNANHVASSRTATGPSERLGNLIVAVWIIGMVFFVLRFAIGVATLSGFARRAEPARFDERVTSRCAELGIERPVRVLLSPLLGMPITWGFLRPVVLLPAESAAWDGERLDTALLHELSHVRRLDAFWHTLVQLACAVYWFHPLVWVAARQHELESEQACDAMVTGAGVSRTRYASHLIHFARRGDVETAPAAPMPMARRTQLRRRLETLLGAGRPTRTNPQTAVAIVIAVALTATAVAALAIDTKQWDDRDWGGKDNDRRGYAHNMFSRSVGTFVLTDNGYTMAKWEDDGSTYSAEIDGAVHFSDDDRRVASISDGGFFVVQEMRGKDKRRYEAYADGHGGIEETFYENANAKRLGDANEWLARMILLIVRKTGIDAERRVDRILETGGPEGVFVEIDALSGDSVRRQYYVYLFENGELDQDQMVVAVQKIGDSISSDGDKTSLLIDIADEFVNDPDLTRQFFETSETISSDGDRRKLIAALMSRNVMDPGTTAIALRSIGSISSDGDQSYLLAEAAEAFEIQGEVAEAFFNALETVSADGDHARVLIRLIAQGNLSEDTQQRLLRSAMGISSDGDLARVLVRFAESNAITVVTSGDFFRATDDISSDSDHRRVLIVVCGQTDLPTEVRMALLRSTEQISSDSDKTAVLVEAAPLYRDDGGLREAYLKTAQTISSDSDYRRVLNLFGTSNTMR